MRRILSIFVVGFVTSLLLVAPAQAATATPKATPTPAPIKPPSDFSLQVSPSPLVATVKPGQPTTLELKIRNGSTGTEELKIEPRGFTFDSANGKISIDDTAPADIAQWISFSAPNFIVKQGEWYTQKVQIFVPKEAGFSYSFALIISRKSNPDPVASGRLIKGSLAIFSLVNIDKPGATRKLEIPRFTTSKSLYEYLPASFEVQFKNTGNSIVQPYGNIFVQRGSSSDSPISTLKVNDSKAYILPGTQRTVTADWEAGFPVYKTTLLSDGSQSRKLAWDWDTVSNFRIGKYTAKLVAVYNDGTRDVPIEQEVSFWVIPWRAILATIGVIAVLVVFGRWRSKRRTEKAVKRALAAQVAAQKQVPADKLAARKDTAS